MAIGSTHTNADHAANETDADTRQQRDASSDKARETDGCSQQQQLAAHDCQRPAEQQQGALVPAIEPPSKHDVH